jgi:O-antigen/teichoic acid export membrane protein
MSRFLRDSIWLTAGTAVSTVANFLGQPVLNYGLGPAGRGVLLLVQTVTSLVLELSRLGATPSTMYLVARGEKVPEVISSDAVLVPLSVVAGVASAAVLVLVTRHTTDPVTVPIAIAATVNVIVRSLGFSISGTTTGLQRFREYSNAIVIGSVSLLALRWLLIKSSGVAGAFWAEAGSGALSLGYLTYLIWRRHGLAATPNRRLMKELFGYGLRQGLSTVTSGLVGRVPGLMLYWLLNPAAAGLYAAGVAMMTPLLLMPGMLGGVLRPRSTAMDAAAAIDQVGVVVRLVMLANLALCGAGALLAYWGLWLLAGSEFLPALRAIQLYLLSIPARGMTLIILSYLAGAGKPEVEGWSSLTSLVAMVAVGGPLIFAMRAHGLALEAAALADLAGALAGLGVALWVFSRLTGAGVAGLLKPRSADLSRLSTALVAVLARKKAPAAGPIQSSPPSQPE